MLRHKAFGLALAVALLVPTGGAALAAEPPPGGLPGVEVPKLDWTACHDGFQCATARVPLDYRRPRLGTIDLAVLRKPAADQSRRIGSLFVNPGGPGGSAVGTARSLAKTGPAELRARFDIIGFDPRGVADSRAVKCQDPKTYGAAWATASSRPAADSFARSVHSGREFVQACQRESGDLLPYIGTEYVARDMDLLRAAVGDPKLSYLGFSFGTYIGTVYANLFPQRTRALVLDGGYDPQHYANSPYAYDITQFDAIEATLHRFFAWCSATPAKCAFGNGNPAAAFTALQAALDAKPVNGANGATMTLEVVFALNGGKSTWVRMAENLVKAQQGTGPLVLPADENAEFFAANVSVECADRAFPRNMALLQARLAYAAREAPLAGPALAYAPPNYDHAHATACVQWPAEQRSRYAGPFHARGSSPILVVGTTGDPDTPYVDSVALSRTLANARLLTFDGEGHTGFYHSPCSKAAITAYLADLRLPARGATCSDDVTP
ncbi:alpha/beta hydrolase [Allokutzneria sp. A3M-2-11 16]|uniref:alpha/beta hydrolase n=1 Tax=Allokutzneria sp. A3M-2-11 16 TaxID=2962043 RepID=UPI0020B7638F|nr:alpha/beta hydrolase [Allokutzneria sp. A3M-2-11 16]MCP3804141.1 alpha/beta hydrolase [Allokutzneria sp. A3M-2-11 16]